MSTATTTGLASILASIAQEGQLTPAMVVDASRPEDAPLHHRFEWDDTVAGERYREVQAAQIIRSVHVELVTDTERGPVRVRAFLAIPSADDDDDREPFTYTALDHLNASAVSAVLRQMERDVANLRRKYRDHRAALDQMLRDSLEAA